VFFFFRRKLVVMQAIEMKNVLIDSRPPSVESLEKMHRLKPDVDANRNNRCLSPAVHRRAVSPQPFHRSLDRLFQFQHTSNENIHCPLPGGSQLGLKVYEEFNSNYVYYENFFFEFYLNIGIFPFFFLWLAFGENFGIFSTFR
jgi:hypothetical protein